VVDVPAGWNRDRAGGERPVVVVGLAHTDETTAEPVEGTGTGQVTVDVFWILDDDETLSGDSTVASTTRAVTVENDSRSYDCRLVSGPANRDARAAFRSGDRRDGAGETGAVPGTGMGTPH